MSVSEARLNTVAQHLEGTDLYLGGHAGRYRIGTLPEDYRHPEGNRADFHAISSTGSTGFNGTLREAEAFAQGVAAGRQLEREE